jgi:hypothetical protein
MNGLLDEMAIGYRILDIHSANGFIGYRLWAGNKNLSREGYSQK